jgi:hypothetical protein
MVQACDLLDIPPDDWPVRAYAQGWNTAMAYVRKLLLMSGEDQRHTHEDVEGEVAEQVASRQTLPDGRIVEQTDHDPAINPPNVVRGNNADL